MVGTLAVVLACAWSAPAQARAPLFGFNDSAGLYGQADPEAAAASAAAAGANSVRLTVDWRTVEPAPGGRDFARYDRLYAAALAHGQRPLLVVAFAPAWARSPTACLLRADCTAPPDPSHDRDFAAFAAAAAQRYPRAVGVEVWNEPNLKVFWGGAPVDPGRYAQLLKATAAAIRAAAPGMPIVTGGLSPHGGEDGDATGMGVRAWLDGLEAAGARGSYDGIGLHAYTGVTLWYGLRAFSLVRETLARHGDRAPLWITEAGLSTTGPEAVAPDVQARYLGRVVPWLRRRANVAGVWVHALYEPATAATTSAERGFGVLAADGAPKPAYCIFARRTCAPPAPDPALRARWRAGLALQKEAGRAIAYRWARGTYSGVRLRARLVRADGPRLLLCSRSAPLCIRSDNSGDWAYGGSPETLDRDRTASW